MSGHEQIKPEKASGRGADELQFISAERHSRWVRALKIILPILALIAAIIFCWFTFFAAPSAKTEIRVNTGEGEGNKLVMTAPKVNGYTKDNRPYALTAEKAIQDPSRPGIIELRHIAGTVPFGGRGMADITAESAFFDNVNGRLHIDQPFTVVTADGMTLRFLSAEANLQSGQMDSPAKVEISDAGRDLTAGSMQLRDNGRLIYFSGGVHIVLNKSGAAAEKAAEKAAETPE